MNNPHVREATLQDYPSIINYFLEAPVPFLRQMGADERKLPSYTNWLTLLTENHALRLEEKRFYYLIWELEGEAIGHSNINKIKFGEEAYMHLHLWENTSRQKGLGTLFVKKSLPHFFETFQLKRLCCEPYALNPAPNKTLENVGFSFIKQYETTPGWINFPQLVNNWCMKVEAFCM